MRAVSLKSAATLAMLCVTAGCSSSSSSDATPSNASPQEVAARFLEAVRVGDDKLTTALLTEKARLKTAESDMVVAPPGSDTASFEVGSVEGSAKDARVETFWTDLNSEGVRQTDRIVWRMRKNSEGWRIYGMSAEMVANQPPTELNFEDPAEMIRKQREAEEEVARSQRAKINRLQEEINLPNTLKR
jgi:hypothetical protein